MSPRPIDPIRLSKTLSFLLRHKPEVGNLVLEEGWAPVEKAAKAAAKLMRRKVRVEDIVALVSESKPKRFDVENGRIRARTLGQSPGNKGVRPPDIVYHATTGSRVEAALQAERLSVPGKPLFLSTDESAAWRVAHRLDDADPRVLYVDTTRARRHGVRFTRNRRTGLYTAESVPTSDVLNLQPGFAEQRSAGGVPVIVGDDGVPRMALIRVTRRSGVTWEIAKGKLEDGETPESAGVREVREEMGIDSELAVKDYVGLIRYGFLAPGGLPRLKSVYFYVMEPTTDETIVFEPRAEEGIKDVQWFTPDDAVKAVTHSSLRPVMRRCRNLVQRLYGNR